jgi:uncharacterized protein YciI
MAQFVLRRGTVDVTEIPKTVRADHARFLGRYRAALVTCGPIWHPVSPQGDRAPAGYAYQLDVPGPVRDAVRDFLAEDPFAAAGLFSSTVTSDWHCALATRLASAPERPGLQGFFFHGTGKPGVTEFRNTIVAAHRAHLEAKDATNCLSRGFLTDAGGKAWLGSAMVYEFADRAALDDYFRTEPYCTNGIYERIDLYDWRRGVID